MSGENTPPPDTPGSSEDAAAHLTPASGQTAAAPEPAHNGTDTVAPAIAVSSQPATLEPADGGAGDQPRPGQQPWWRPRPFSRPLWYPVAGAAAVLALVAGGAMTLLTVSRGPQAGPLAADCGLVTCGASLPPAVTGPAVPSSAAHSIARAHRRHRAARRRVLAPAVHSRLRPPALPGRPSHRRHLRPAHPGGPAPAAVTVIYAVDGTDPWHRGFRAHLTIVNHGTTPVAGWTVRVSLPGDQVDWAGYPGAWDPFANWQFSGDTLALNALSGGETLAPGATEIVPIAAQGSHTVPGGCQFDGSACQP